MLLNRAVLSLAKLASKDASRYTLQGFAVEKDRAIVTDGTILVGVMNEHPVADENFPAVAGLEHKTFADGPMIETVLVHRDAALAALKAIPKKNTIPALYNAAMGTDGNLYTTDLENVSQFKHKMNGARFPNWRQVMPTGEPIASVSFDVRKMRQLCDYIAENGDARMATAKLTIYGADKAMRLDSKTSDGTEVFALLMSCRDGK